MAAAHLSLADSRLPLPADGSFASGLRNIRHAIESRLAGLGFKSPSLGDTAARSARGVPGMVIVDVAAGGKAARVTFTRDEVEDCARCVEVHCVMRKIDHLVLEIAGA
ncbi:MAG TPA: hypothetical protein VHV81_03005 [Steroidobacteraceae bacterium]|jgi:hypothetical protein|nr:hypothetical protein [Steroidobacteraceae bacterium]